MKCGKARDPHLPQQRIGRAQILHRPSLLRRQVAQRVQAARSVRIFQARHPGIVALRRTFLRVPIRSASSTSTVPRRRSSQCPLRMAGFRRAFTGRRSCVDYLCGWPHRGFCASARAAPLYRASRLEARQHIGPPASGRQIGDADFGPRQRHRCFQRGHPAGPARRGAATAIAGRAARCTHFSLCVAAATARRRCRSAGRRPCLGRHLASALDRNVDERAAWAMAAFGLNFWPIGACRRRKSTC